MLGDELKAWLLESGDFEELAQLPPYLRGYEYGWAPTFVLRRKKPRRVVGFELVYASDLPFEVLKEAKRAQDEQVGFDVVLLASLTAAGDELYEYCRTEGFGLFVFTGDLIRPIVDARFQKSGPEHGATVDDEGWVWPDICERVEGLKHIQAHEIIWAHIPKLRESGVSQLEAAATVQAALDQIIRSQRERFAAPFPFYRLAGLENLLSPGGPSQQSDHVVHSFRVYVAGCVILDHFWSFINEKWKAHIGLNGVRIDDVWFLTSAASTMS